MKNPIHFADNGDATCDYCEAIVAWRPYDEATLRTVAVHAAGGCRDIRTESDARAVLGSKFRPVDWSSSRLSAMIKKVQWPGESMKERLAAGPEEPRPGTYVNDMGFVCCATCKQMLARTSSSEWADVFRWHASGECARDASVTASTPTGTINARYAQKDE